jgi:hypothetical protein
VHSLYAKQRRTYVKIFVDVCTMQEPAVPRTANLSGTTHSGKNEGTVARKTMLEVDCGPTAVYAVMAV